MVFRAKIHIYMKNGQVFDAVMKTEYEGELKNPISIVNDAILHDFECSKNKDEFCTLFDESGFVIAFDPKEVSCIRIEEYNPDSCYVNSPKLEMHAL